MKQVSLCMSEWTSVSARDPGGEELRGLTLSDAQARRTARLLEQRGMLVVREAFEGLEVEATSFVGRVRVGNVTVAIQPKIAPDLLLRLFRYAYGLRRLPPLDPASFGAGNLFHELIIRQLCREVMELTRRGVHRRYVGREESLASPRGRVLLDRVSPVLVRPEIPCRHYARDRDWHVNRVVVAGLAEARRLTNDPSMRAQLRRLGDGFQGVRPIDLHPQAFARAWAALDRMSRIYNPVLALIQVIHSGRAIALETNEADLVLDGFLYDMNRFFQALLGRLLRESLGEWEVREEWSLSQFMRYAPDANPRGRSAPRPRPDFAVRRAGSHSRMFLDAKYRDLWTRDLPSSMLYQLAVYALSQQGQPSATILFPAIGPDAKEAKVELRDPVAGGTRATVVLRPVDLVELDRVVEREDPISRELRSAFATRLVLG
jgi:5-methylcytosine-specific restriction enzyme subunit McrC